MNTHDERFNFRLRRTVKVSLKSSKLHGKILFKFEENKLVRFKRNVRRMQYNFLQKVFTMV